MTFNPSPASSEVIAPSLLLLSQALAWELSLQGLPHHVPPSSPQFPEHSLGGKEQFRIHLYSLTESLLSYLNAFVIKCQIES